MKNCICFKIEFDDTFFVCFSVTNFDFMEDSAFTVLD